MSKSIDQFFFKEYNEKTYDCLHFTIEVWEYLTGENLEAKLMGLLGSASSRNVQRQHRIAFEVLSEPKSPCLAFISRPKHTPHVGVYIDGRILHIMPDSVEFQPPEVAKRFFTKVKYYMPCKE